MYVPSVWYFMCLKKICLRTKIQVKLRAVTLRWTVKKVSNLMEKSSTSEKMITPRQVSWLVDCKKVPLALNWQHSLCPGRCSARGTRAGFQGCLWFYHTFHSVLPPSEAHSHGAWWSETLVVDHSLQITNRSEKLNIPGNNWLFIWSWWLTEFLKVIHKD